VYTHHFTNARRGSSILQYSERPAEHTQQGRQLKRRGTEREKIYCEASALILYTTPGTHRQRAHIHDRLCFIHHHHRSSTTHSTHPHSCPPLQVQRQCCLKTTMLPYLRDGLSSGWRICTLLHRPSQPPLFPSHHAVRYMMLMM